MKRIFVLVICLIAVILQAVFTRLDSRKQKKYADQGKFQIRSGTSSGTAMLALGIFVFLFVNAMAALTVIAGGEEAAEEARGMMLICQGLGILILLVCILVCYMVHADKAFCSEEGITISKAFRADRKVSWEEIRGIAMRGNLCLFYDSFQNVLFKTTAQAENFDRMFQMAKSRVEAAGGTVKWN